MPDVLVFHAGTALRDGKLVVNGGRVLNVVAYGADYASAAAKAYAAADLIRFPDRHLRRDIAARAIAAKKR
jgi:phosphoribosylamine--glycine ligase